MFKTKYNISLLDTKWNPIKRNLYFNSIPVKDEFIFYNEKYYHVVNIVHSVGKKHEIFIIVDEFKQPEQEKNNFSEKT
jgi:hypothetical protein